MKVLLLDHDGCISLASNWGTRFKKKGATGTIDDAFDNFDKKAIKVLNEIIKVWEIIKQRRFLPEALI